MKDKKLESNYFDRAFWATIILMFVVTLGLLITGQLRDSDLAVPSTNTNTNANSRVNIETAPEPTSPPPHEIPKPVLLEIFTVASDAAEAQVLNLLDEQLDELFVPVYTGISDYAEFHYSVLGEYTELTAAVTQNMGAEIEERLFGGFTERVENLGTRIDTRFQQAFEENVSENVAQSFPQGQQVSVLAAVTLVVIDDVVNRSKFTVPVASVSALAAVSTLKIISKNMAQVMAAKVALKFAAKGAVKAGAGLGGAGTGAALGSALGPVGALIGGIGGAVVTYFAVDAVIINIDQYFNQEEFEADLADLVQSMRNDLHADIELALTRKKDDIQDFTLNEL